jgi:hypothetical protein
MAMTLRDHRGDPMLLCPLGDAVNNAILAAKSDADEQTGGR